MTSNSPAVYTHYLPVIDFLVDLMSIVTFLGLMQSLEVNRHISKCHLIQLLLSGKGSRFKQNQLKLCVLLFLRFLSCFDVLFSVLKIEPFTG